MKKGRTFDGGSRKVGFETKGEEEDEVLFFPWMILQRRKIGEKREKQDLEKK